MKKTLKILSVVLVLLALCMVSVGAQVYSQGDTNGDGDVNSDDAILLLRHTLSSGRFPICVDGDMNGDGTVNSDDAIYLLRHTLAPSRFPLLNCDHTETVMDEAKAPTCTETGLTEGSHCAKCGKVMVAQETVDALGHDEQTHDAQEPICQIGWREYVTCKRDGCDYSTYEEIPANHDMVDGMCTRCYYPYIPIRTVDDLINVSSNLRGNYILMNDLDLGGMEWTPIGTSGSAFTGTFDGNGYAISNFKITGDVEYAGLFGYNKGTIQNLGVEEFTIDVNRSGYSYAGGLVGRN